MELKAKIDKPYTIMERAIFVAEQNNALGYEIKETDTELQAWGYTDEEIEQQREEDFMKKFFQTSLGYIRRDVTMADGSTKDFLTQLLPSIAIGFQLGQVTNVIAYEKPPFDEEITDWAPYQSIVPVTAEFIQECLARLGQDFKPMEIEDV